LNKRNENRPGYKETKAGWIPESWEVVSFDNIAKRRKERFNPKNGKNFKCIELEHIEQTTGIVIGYVNSKDQASTKNKFYPNDVLFGKLRPYLRKYTLVDFEGVCSSEIWVFKNQSISMPEFVHLIVQSNKFIAYSNKTSGTKMPRAEWDLISGINFPLPPLHEQQKIASIIFTWDKAIELVGKQIEAKQRLTKGLMQQLLTGKIRFPRYSGNWHELKILSVAQVIMGQSPNSSAYNDAGLGLPLIQGNTDIKDRKTAPRMYTSVITRQCEIGDIILSVRAPVGETSWSLHEACIGRGVCAIRATKTDSKFLFYKLVFDESRWIRFAQGSTFEAINSKDIRNLSIWIPCSLSEQSHIASVFVAIDGEIELLNKHILKLRRQKQGLMQKLLTGEVRVKL